MDTTELAHPRADVKELDEARQAFLAVWTQWVSSNPSRIEIAEELTGTTSAMIQIARLYR